MIKPKRLKKGDKIAVVSLSWGGLGEEKYIHKWHIAKERLERDFGLEVICMPHALKGDDFLYAHPELRAKDWMDAFTDPSVAAIFSAIGGDDTIRLLPYIDFEVIRKNPKIFMGYSDTTINHLMMYKAGVLSFYGPSVMAELGEYGKIMDYTEKAIRDILFGGFTDYLLLPAGEWSDDFISWSEQNQNRTLQMKEETRGYEILCGSGIVQGHLLGGCLEVLNMANGTELWPAVAEWKGALLFLETSEDKPVPSEVKYFFRNLAAQGILQGLNGIIMGKPKDETYYEEYKEVVRQVVITEEKRNIPIFYNINIGHAKPIGILPYGIQAELNCEEKTIRFLECPTREE